MGATQQSGSSMLSFIPEYLKDYTYMKSVLDPRFGEVFFYQLTAAQDPSLPQKPKVVLVKDKFFKEE
jgi:hypothetical protein